MDRQVRCVHQYVGCGILSFAHGDNNVATLASANVKPQVVRPGMLERQGVIVGRAPTNAGDLSPQRYPLSCMASAREQCRPFFPLAPPDPENAPPAPFAFSRGDPLCLVKSSQPEVDSLQPPGRLLVPFPYFGCGAAQPLRPPKEALHVGDRIDGRIPRHHHIVTLEVGDLKL